MIDAARDLIGASERIVAFSGAGLSAESGVPTFRDAETQGFWTNYDAAKLATPEGFANDPELVYKWYTDRRRNMAAVQPNPAHLSLARRRDIVNVTQNIDDLLHRAGAVRIIQLHGTLMTDRCLAECGYEEPVEMADPPGLRACPQCGALLRPAVVWFGEPLPFNAWREAEDLCASCDLMLVIGTAAEVYPAAGLIGLAKRAGAKIIVINPNPSQASALADIELVGKAGALMPDLMAV